MLRLLIIEDDELAAELMLGSLLAAGLPCACERVQSEVEFRAALEHSPDLILSDSNVPGFAGLAALTIAKDERPAIPFIFVSGHMSEAAVRRARDGGALDFVAKADLGRLPDVVRSALQPHSDTSPGALNQPPGDARHGDAGRSAQYLLQRQEALEKAVEDQTPSGLSSLLRRTPPSPAALVMIESDAIRERYVKLLGTADVQADVAVDPSAALRLLNEKIHALLFTDRLELIAHARQLDAGSATHMVFVTNPGAAGRSEGLRAGANDVMPEEARGEDFWAQMTVARRIVSFADSLRSAVTDNQLLSTIDELTRVGNKRYFEHQWSREVARAVRSQRPLSLLICDIDHFKAINDQYGHPAGDAVLSEFGERLTRGLRLGEDWVARIGGEEFAIVLPETGGSSRRARLRSDSGSASVNRHSPALRCH